MPLSASELRMTDDNVLVRLDRSHALRGNGGLVLLPDEAAENDRVLIGAVVSVGPGYYPDVRVLPDRPLEPNDRSPHLSGAHRIPTTVRVGERVLLDGKLAGEQLWLDNAEHRIVREAEILGVVEP